MRLLLDTHIFLWLINDDRRLSDKYRQEIYVRIYSTLASKATPSST